MLGKVVAGVAVASLATVLTAPVASAARANSASCSGGSMTANYSPGLNVLTQELKVTATGKATGCTAKGHDITSASLEIEGDGMGSCVTGWSGGGTMRIRWSDGKESKLDWHGSASQNISAFHGKVTSGLFKGKAAYMQMMVKNVGYQTILQCAAGVVGAGGYKKGVMDLTEAVIHQ